MGSPPFEAGALHVKFAPPACGVAFKFNGAEGLVEITTFIRV